MKTSLARVAVLVVIAAMTGCGKKTDALSGSNEASPALAGVAPACGGKGLPDCPLQAWMKGNVGSRMSAGDTVALAKAFHRIAALAPPGFEGWAATSAAGEKAAWSGDLEGARAACRDCHSNLRDRYRERMRSRPLPP